MRVIYDARTDTLSILLSSHPVAESDEEKPASSSTTTPVETSSRWRSSTASRRVDEPNQMVYELAEVGSALAESPSAHLLRRIHAPNTGMLSDPSSVTSSRRRSAPGGRVDLRPLVLGQRHEGGAGGGRGLEEIAEVGNLLGQDPRRLQSLPRPGGSPGRLIFGVQEVDRREP